MDQSAILAARCEEKAEENENGAGAEDISAMGRADAEFLMMMPARLTKSLPIAGMMTTWFSGPCDSGRPCSTPCRVGQADSLHPMDVSAIIAGDIEDLVNGDGERFCGWDAM